MSFSEISAKILCAVEEDEEVDDVDVVAISDEVTTAPAAANGGGLVPAAADLRGAAFFLGATSPP